MRLGKRDKDVRREAVAKAKDRLASAKARLSDLESSKDYDSARRHWYDFLLSSNAIFSVLEQGAKGIGQSDAWFSGKKRERKTDELLCYLHHARNADEHNIPSVTELDRQKLVLVEGDKPVAAIEDVTDTGNRGEFRGVYRKLGTEEPNLRKVTNIHVYPDRAKLIRVTDRGVGYDPPSSHLGSPLDDNGPNAVARLMVQYVERLVSEAEALAGGPAT